jgi:cytochrome c oxidase assembly factor CtaG
MRHGALLAAVLALAVTGALSLPGDLLFSIHMIQHLLLIAVAAPLLVLGGFEIRMPPLAGWGAFIAAFLFWHWPLAFGWAATHHLGTLLEMGSILLAAVCFWSGILGRNCFNDGARALLVMTAAVLTDLPGVVMLFSPRAICVMPHESAARFGLSPLQDQQLAGLLMWVPANLVFFGIATFLFARWISGRSSAPGAGHAHP